MRRGNIANSAEKNLRKKTYALSVIARTLLTPKNDSRKRGDRALSRHLAGVASLMIDGVARQFTIYAAGAVSLAPIRPLGTCAKLTAVLVSTVCRSRDSLLLWQVHSHIMYTGNKCASDRQADHEQYQPVERRLCRMHHNDIIDRELQHKNYIYWQ